jgi:hypothetical protein
MTPNTNVKTQPSPPVSLAPPIMFGAGIALIVISFFVFGVDAPNPEWGKFWMIRPLVVTPLAGATGGAVYYFLDNLRYKGNLNPTVAIILSLIIYIVGLWLGIVLGLDGTLWD